MGVLSRSAILTFLFLLSSFLIYPGSEPWQQNPILNNEFSDIQKSYLALQDTSLNREAYSLGMAGFNYLLEKKLIRIDTMITIIDFSKPSSEKRFYVINLKTNKLQVITWVAHGRNSGELYATSFSNQVHSYKSALGFFVTGEPYEGSQGYSLQICGIDTGFNENSKTRSIVIHGADYVSEKYITQYGRLGRSFGCPALPENINSRIIDLIKNGSLLFCYYPDKNYLAHARMCYGISEEPFISMNP